MIKNRTKLVPWVLAAFVLLIYLSFPTRNYYWDGISFAQTIEDAQGLHPSLIHPSHLIYNVVGYLFYRVIRLVGIDIRALTALQLMSSVLSAMCAFVLFHILRSAFRSIYICSTL